MHCRKTLSFSRNQASFGHNLPNGTTGSGRVPGTPPAPREGLQKGALDLGVPGRDNSYGYGLVQAKAALAYLGGGGGGSTDTTPPAIAGVSFRKTDNRGTFEIFWTTDEPSTSQVTFISTTNQTFTSATLVTIHKMTFKGVKGQTYTFTVSSTDAAGNKATSVQYTYPN